MKLMIPVETESLDAPVCPSFGRSPLFVLTDTENGTQKYLTNSAADSQGGAGIRAAQLVADSKADVLITYRCGQNAETTLSAAGVKIYRAADGSAKENILKYQKGELPLLTEFHAGFHHHGGTPE